MNSQDLLRQNEILELLRDDRDRGAALLLETYTPLLWAVCRNRLSDPEDIKECVNDVFTKFCLNPGQYDPSQSSLKNYLATMADRRAISYYRSNQRRSEAETAAKQNIAADQADLSADLAEAISTLSEEDARIIRLKYYGGMTYGEIAAQMGITEAAAKKRGTRSLKKLAKWLIIGLIIAALLAGCVYVVHYFRYARGFGLVQEAETAVYQLAEPVEPAYINGMAIRPLNVTYLEGEGSLLVQIAFLPWQSEFSALQYDNTIVSYWLSANSAGNIACSYRSDWLCEFTLTVPLSVITSDENGNLHLTLTLTPQDYHIQHIARNYGYEMDVSPLHWDIILEAAETAQNLTDLGYFLDTARTDFLVTTDRALPGESDDDYALVSLSSLGGTEGYTLSERLSTWYSLLAGYEQEMPILLDDAGTRYLPIHSQAPLPNRSVRQHILRFDGLPAGEYTLNIPSLCYRLECDPIPNAFTLPLPREDGVTLACDERMTLPDGTVIHITGITRQIEEDPLVYNFAVETLVDGVSEWTVVEDTLTKWQYILSYEVDTVPAFPLCGLATTIDFSVQTEDGLLPIPITPEMHRSVSGLDFIVFGARDGLNMAAPDAMTIHLDQFYYLDQEDHAIRITIP